MKIDYLAIRSLASDVGSLAADVNLSTIRSLNAINGDLSSNFEGSAATVFKSKIDELSEDISSLVSTLNGISNELYNYAAEIKALDEALAAMIESNQG